MFWPIIILIAVTVIMISIVWPNWRGAPWVPTPLRTVRKMLDMAQVGPDDVLYDLGCGDGRTLVTAARRYGARVVGVEIDPLRYAWCQLLITLLGLRDRVQIVYGDLFEQDLSKANVLTCYLLSSTNKRLERKLKRELRPETRVISYYFLFPGLRAIAKDSEERLYLYDLNWNQRPPDVTENS
jgi:predicted RNA methylase